MERIELPSQVLETSILPLDDTYVCGTEENRTLIIGFSDQYLDQLGNCTIGLPRGIQTHAQPFAEACLITWL